MSFHCVAIYRTPMKLKAAILLPVNSVSESSSATSGRAFEGSYEDLRQWPGLEELLFQHPLAHSELLFAPGFLLADPVVHPESAGPEAVPHISLLLKRPVAVV